MSFEKTLTESGASTVAAESSLLGFYHTFGTFTMKEWLSDDDGELNRECGEIQRQLADRFSKNLRSLPEWHEHHDGITMERFEVCADDLEEEDVGGRPAFSLWVYSGGQAFTTGVMKSFKAAFMDAILSLSEDSSSQIQVTYLKTMTQTVYRVTHQETHDI